MQLTDNESELLKQFVIKRLADVSDADSDVLADYVLALVKSDDPDAQVRANCISNLQDFLQDTTESFVDEIFTAIQTKSYDPNRPIQPAQLAFESRKRAFEDDGVQNGRVDSSESGDRPVKQLRRGGGLGGHRGGFDGGRGGRHPQTQAHQQWQPPQAPQMPQFTPIPQMPAPPPGMPPFDPSDPMAMMLAMQQVMGLPGMSGSASEKKPGRRCYDYDSKGFCARGASCPYEHGEEAYVVTPNEPYDPFNSTMLGSQSVNMTGTYDTRGRGRGRGRGGKNFRGGSRRAEISHMGQNHDRSNTTIVVEQIPEDKFDEQLVRGFFSEFGNVEEVSMQPYKRLATVRYDNYDSAKAAYDSPKVIFENRFVKVYWHKSDGDGNVNGNATPFQKEVKMEEPEPQIDHEEVAQRQAEAQRKHEENMKQREAAAKQKSEIDAKIKAMEDERKQLAEKLAKKGSKAGTPATQTVNGNDAIGSSDKTKGLKEQIAKLEAEAQSLGIDPNAPPDSWSPYTLRGRGGFRGRGFAPRGRGFNPDYRGGSWQGASARGGAVKRLDNRPRTISIGFPSGTYDEHDEALRQYLLLSNNLDRATLTRHPDRADAALLVFEERYRAENFMAGAQSGIPHVGQVSLAWQANAPVALPSNGSNGHAMKAEVKDDDSNMDFSEPAGYGEVAAGFDVADDDDRW